MVVADDGGREQVEQHPGDQHRLHQDERGVAQREDLQDEADGVQQYRHPEVT